MLKKIGGFLGTAATKTWRKLPTLDGAAEAIGTSLFGAQILPFAMLGAPLMKAGPAILKGAAAAGGGLLSAGAGIGQAFASRAAAGNLPVGAMLASAAGGYAIMKSGNFLADRARRKNDPANTMGLTQSLHSAYR